MARSMAGEKSRFASGAIDRSHRLTMTEETTTERIALTRLFWYAGSWLVPALLAQCYAGTNFLGFFVGPAAAAQGLGRLLIDHGTLANVVTTAGMVAYGGITLTRKRPWVFVVMLLVQVALLILGIMILYYSAR